MGIGAGLGLAALIIAGIGMWIPFVGLFIGWLALAIACFAALCGDKGLTVATVVFSAVVFLIFTPTLWLEAGASADETSGYGSPIFIIISIAMLIAPIVSIVLFSTGKLVLKQRNATGPNTQ